MNDDLVNKLAIRELIDNWIIWSDAGDWERFRTIWHDDGYMSATWFEGTADDFTRGRREGWERGVSILHFQGGTTIDLAGNRADCPDEDADFSTRDDSQRPVRRALYRALL